MGIKKLYKAGAVILVLLLVSCQMFFGEDDKLSLQRRPYDGSSLKMDGYYYVKSKSGDMVSIYFLSRNGLIINAGACKTEELMVYEKNFTDTSFVNKVISLKYNWGVFQIDRDSIKFERWQPSERPYRTKIKEGVLLNDTTFLITKVHNQKGERSLKNEVYHFKRFTPKIDSISKYID